MSTAKSTALRRELAAEFLSDASTDDRQLVEASGARDGVATSTTLKPGRQRPAGEQSTTDRKVATTMQRVTDASVVSKDRAPVTERPRLIAREPPSDQSRDAERMDVSAGANSPTARRKAAIESVVLECQDVEEVRHGPADGSVVAAEGASRWITQKKFGYVWCTCGVMEVAYGHVCGAIVVVHEMVCNVNRIRWNHIHGLHQLGLLARWLGCRGAGWLAIGWAIGQVRDCLLE